MKISSWEGSSIQNPNNVCGMFDIGESEGAHLIECVHGEDLKTTIGMTVMS